MLTKILDELTLSTFRKDHKLKGGLILSWLPPHELRISRPGVPPSAQELATIERHLKNMDILYSTMGLKNITHPKTGRKWFYWKLIITRQPKLI